MSDAATLRDTAVEDGRASPSEFSSVRKNQTRAAALVLGALLLAACGNNRPVSAPSPRLALDLSGAGWHLWLDRTAKWEDDEPFLPTAPRDKLPVNPPTGGWDALAAAKADRWDVAVPGTVEQYAWDAL